MQGFERVVTNSVNNVYAPRSKILVVLKTGNDSAVGKKVVVVLNSSLVIDITDTATDFRLYLQIKNSF